jgi:hypothetical protein
LACGSSMCLPCVDGHSFSHSMITHEPFVRFNGFIDSFSCGLGRVCRHSYRPFFVGPRLCSCDASIGSSHVVPLDIFVVFLMIASFSSSS